MKRRLRLPLYVLILSGLLVSMKAKADTWGNPNVKTYYSKNKEFKLTITPKRTPDKYYLWEHYKSNRHPQTKNILRKKEKFMQNISEQDTIVIPCTAELYQMNGLDSILIWKRTLLNDVCPIHAIVANDGLTVATFDNWYYYGYDVNVFVIYNQMGDAKRTYKLEEFSPYPLNDYSISISSLFWRREVKFIDNERIEIIFENKKNETTQRIYNVRKLEFENNAP